MPWYRRGRVTDNNGVLDVQKALNEAMVALSAAENQLAACIERVKEHRQSVEHDELVLKEIAKNLGEILKSKIIRVKEYDGLRRGIREIRKSLVQRRVNLEAARDAVDRAEDARDELLQKVGRLKTRTERYQKVVPWKKKSE